MCKLGDVLSKLVQLKRITHGGLWAKPPTAGRFFKFFKKTIHFNAVASQFARVWSHSKELDF